MKIVLLSNVTVEVLAGFLRKEHQVRTLQARWSKTAKNAPVADLFDKLGFERMETHEDMRRYRMDLGQMV